VLAALYHPLRLPRVALLDMLSGGRVNWGAARLRPFEFNAFGVPQSKAPKRFREPSNRPAGLDRGALHVQGHALPVRRHRSAAKPMQRPQSAEHWMAATSEPAIDWRPAAAFPS